MWCLFISSPPLQTQLWWMQRHDICGSPPQQAAFGKEDGEEKVSSNSTRASVQGHDQPACGRLQSRVINRHHQNEHRCGHARSRALPKPAPSRSRHAARPLAPTLAVWSTSSAQGRTPPAPSTGKCSRLPCALCQRRAGTRTRPSGAGPSPCTRTARCIHTLTCSPSVGGFGRYFKWSLSQYD